jgi:hypothetical protein
MARCCRVGQVHFSYALYVILLVCFLLAYYLGPPKPRAQETMAIVFYLLGGILMFIGIQEKQLAFLLAASAVAATALYRAAHASRAPSASHNASMLPPATPMRLPQPTPLHMPSTQPRSQFLRSNHVERVRGLRHEVESSLSPAVCVCVWSVVQREPLRLLSRGLPSHRLVVRQVASSPHRVQQAIIARVHDKPKFLDFLDGDDGVSREDYLAYLDVVEVCPGICRLPDRGGALPILPLQHRFRPRQKSSTSHSRTRPKTATTRPPCSAETKMVARASVWHRSGDTCRPPATPAMPKGLSSLGAQQREAKPPSSAWPHPTGSRHLPRKCPPFQTPSGAAPGSLGTQPLP